jgi:hypothetical protein
MYRKKTEPWVAVDSVPLPQSPGVVCNSMEELYNKIINHIILKLKNGETRLTKVLIAKELDISVSEFDDICEKRQIPKFLIELSKTTKSREWIKRITDNFENMEAHEIGNDFMITRERIRQIEAKAMMLINKMRNNPPDDVA